MRFINCIGLTKISWKNINVSRIEGIAYKRPVPAFVYCMCITEVTQDEQSQTRVCTCAVYSNDFLTISNEKPGRSSSTGRCWFCDRNLFREQIVMLFVAIVNEYIKLFGEK